MPKNSFAAVILLLLSCTDTLLGATTLESVYRDVQARFNFLGRFYFGADEYLVWPPCKQFKVPAPHYPKDGFYGNPEEDPEYTVLHVQFLAEYIDFLGLHVEFVNAPNGLGDLDGVAAIVNYPSGDPNFHPPVDPAQITTNNYREKLEILGSQLAKMNLIKSDLLTQVVNGRRLTRHRHSSDCGSAEQCVVELHPSTAWGDKVLVEDCTPGSPQSALALERIGVHFETLRQGSFWYAAAVNRRGHLSADLRPSLNDLGARADNAIGRIFLRIAPVDPYGGFYPTTMLQLESPNENSVFGQTRPVSAAVGTNFGLWPQAIVKVGVQSTTEDVAYSDLNPVPVGGCVSNLITMVGWEIVDQMVVIQPDFNVEPDPEDCCACAKCEAGTLTPSLGSARLSIALGGDNFGGSAGSLTLAAAKPAGVLSTPAGLRFSVASTVKVIPEYDFPKLQFKTSQVLVNIVTNSAYKYTLSFYTSADAGTTNGSGFYQPTGTAFTTITVENPDTTTATNRLRVTHVTEGTTNVTDYTYTAATDQWEMSTGGGLRKDTTSSSWDVGFSHRTETNLVKNAANEVVYRDVNIYGSFPWGQERITSTFDPGGAALTSTWSYYTNSGDGGNYRKLKEAIDSSGHWTRYQYDHAGRETNRVMQFLSSDVGSAENLNRVISTTYSTNVPQITIVEKLLGMEIGRRYQVTGPGELRDIQCQETGAVWNASGNLVTITRRWTNGSFLRELFRVANPDGTVEIHLCATNATEKTTTVLSGAPDPSSETNILRGTLETTVTGLAGEIRSRTVKRRLPGQSDLTTERDTYTYLDARNRSYRVVHLDGTTNFYNYACCGLESETDRDGTTTTFLHDGLKRQIGSIRNGIATTNLLDARSAVLATVRVGTNGSTITMGTAKYDLAGRLTNSTDALSQATVHGETNDAAGQTIRTTIYPDAGTRIETIAKDGTLLKMTGTAVRPVRYTNGVETTGPDAGRFYSQEIKLTAAWSDTGEWTKRYRDPAGRDYKTLFPDDSYSVSYFNSVGQLSKHTDAVGRSTVYVYDDLGEVATTVVDMDWDDGRR